MQNKTHIVCECGKSFTTNTARVHVNSKHCTCSSDYKNKIIKYTDHARIHRLAWDARLGQEAKSFHWVGSVLSGQMEFKDLVFESPRPIGVSTPSALSRSSAALGGSANPCSQINLYGQRVVRDKIVSLYREYIDKPNEWNTSITQHVANRLDLENPNWQLGLIVPDSAGRPLSKKRKIAEVLRELCIDFESNFRRVRGRMISKGQRNSPECIRKSRESAIKNGIRRTTKPQLRLYSIIQKYDKDAVLEFSLDHKLFDICAPNFGTLIEMHGRIWHDLNNCPDSLRQTVGRNVINDAVKVEIANKNGYKLIVFWDDQEDNWDTQWLDWMSNAKN